MRTDRCPYKGLRPYTEHDYLYFFGRDGDREIVAANLKASRLTVLYGASGVGKSSLLRAAVLHDINETAKQQISHGRQPDFIAAYCQDWRDNPRENIAAALRRAWAQVGLTWPEPAPGGGLLGFLQSQSQTLKAATLLVLDQFEEYLYYHASSGEEENANRDLIEIVSNRSLRTNIMIALREDAVTRLDQFKGSISSLYDNYLRLDHLKLPEAREAIVLPLETYNKIENLPPVQIEPALVDAVLDQVRTGKLSFRDVAGSPAVSAERDSVETPYLQLVLTLIWEEEAAAGSTVLRRDTLHRLGEAHAIVRTHLDARMDSFTEEEQRIAERIFFHLVTPSRTKVAHTVPDLAAFAEVDQHLVSDLITKLAGSEHRIVRAVPPLNPDSGLTRFEIYHDALADAILDWQQRFRLKIQQQELELQRARRDREQEEQREREHERERSKRQRKLMVASAAAGLLCLALALLAVGFARRAQQQSRYAEQQRLVATAASRVADQRLQSIRTSLLIRQAALSGDESKLQFAIDSAKQNPDIKFQTTATSLGYQDGAGRTIHRFRLAPDLATLPGGPQAVAFITYLADHPTFTNTLMTAGPKRSFAVLYDGWGCLPIVALIEYADPTQAPTVSEFDMCAQLGWR